jgi:hypothetical protein
LLERRKHFFGASKDDNEGVILPLRETKESALRIFRKAQEHRRLELRRQERRQQKYRKQSAVGQIGGVVMKGQIQVAKAKQSAIGRVGGVAMERQTRVAKVNRYQTKKRPPERRQTAHLQDIIASSTQRKEALPEFSGLPTVAVDEKHIVCSTPQRDFFDEEPFSSSGIWYYQSYPPSGESTFVPDSVQTPFPSTDSIQSHHTKYVQITRLPSQMYDSFINEECPTAWSEGQHYQSCDWWSWDPSSALAPLPVTHSSEYPAIHTSGLPLPPPSSPML